MRTKHLAFGILLSSLIIFCGCLSQLYSGDISTITLDKKNVYDPASKENIFLGNIMNSLHVMTKDYVIEDELIFADDEDLYTFDIYETERILRTLNIFSNVSVTAKETNDNKFDIKVVTQDRWSLEPTFLYGSGGGALSIGGGLREWNLFGIGTYLQLDALHRSENNIGWEGLVSISQRRIFRSPFSLSMMLQSNSVKTDQYISLQKAFLNYRVEDSFGADFYRSFGDIYYYNTGIGTERLPYRLISGSVFYSHQWLQEDKVYFTIQAQFSKENRGKPELRQAFDNTANILASFSSVSDNYIPVDHLDTYLTQDLCTGGYGNAVLGKIFSIAEGGENLYYLGAQGEQSLFVGNNLFLYGQLTGSSGFTGNAKGKYTYLEFVGTGFYRFFPSLVLATRVRHQSVWNWFAKRQLVLDNDAGLRGFRVNAFAGDNRFVSNIELRFFPDWRFWILNISGVLFTDIASSWNQDTKIYDARWNQSIGFGFRIHNMKSSSQSEVIRFDFAYNLTEKKFAGIVISSGQLFSLINPHKYKLPELFGREFDEY